MTEILYRLREAYQQANDYGPSGEADFLAEVLAAIEQRDAEIARLREALDAAAPWTCPECGPHVKADEDGCCATCGADAALAAQREETK